MFKEIKHDAFPHPSSVRLRNSSWQNTNFSESLDTTVLLLVFLSPLPLSSLPAGQVLQPFYYVLFTFTARKVYILRACSKLLHQCSHYKDPNFSFFLDCAVWRLFLSFALRFSFLWLPTYCINFSVSAENVPFY